MENPYESPANDSIAAAQQEKRSFPFFGLILFIITIFLLAGLLMPVSSTSKSAPVKSTPIVPAVPLEEDAISSELPNP